MIKKINIKIKVDKEMWKIFNGVLVSIPSYLKMIKN